MNGLNPFFNCVNNSQSSNRGRETVLNGITTLDFVQNNCAFYFLFQPTQICSHASLASFEKTKLCNSALSVFANVCLMRSVQFWNTISCSKPDRNNIQSE